MSIRLRWPLLLAESARDTTMLRELEQAAWRSSVRDRLKGPHHNPLFCEEISLDLFVEKGYNYLLYRVL